MIRSELTVGNRVVETGVFPLAATCRGAMEGMARVTYSDSEVMRCFMTERRVGRFVLMRQEAQVLEDCSFTVRRTGEPVLMLTWVGGDGLVRARREDRFWRAGDVGLALLPQEDVVRNSCVGGKRFAMYNIVVPQPVVRQMAERHPDALGRMCRDFEQGGAIDYCHSPASRRMRSLLRAVERCADMGGYADRYLEAVMVDCLSDGVALSDGGRLSPVAYNFALRDKMYDARQIVERQMQAPPSLHELAQMVGTNECTLKAAFRQTFGVTVFQHLYDCRMDEAARYLQDTSLPVADIGLLLGYERQSHFCTAFRRRYGLSPSQWRAQRQA